MPKKAKPKFERGRFSSKKKMEAVLRLLQGEDLDVVSRDVGVAGATLANWKEVFLQSGQAGLKSRGNEDDRDAEIKALHTKIGEITMENELLRERSRAAETKVPLARRRSRR